VPRGSPPDAEVALFFGYVRHYKGLDVLLDAWPRVRAHRPVELLVAGEFYEDPVPYRDKVAALGSPAVRLLDHYLPDAEVETVFKAADVVVLPYRSATQSGVTHVAYAMGLPVITTDVGGLAETVVPGVTGLVARPEDPEALAEAVLSYFTQSLGPKLRSGVEDVKRAHSWEALAAATLELIETLEPGRGWA
jgi:glycosyltransferase involved in cell wall biosynthesis